jgi:hypothetical protein
VKKNPRDFRSSQMTSQLSCARCFGDFKQFEFVVEKKIPIGMGTLK